MKFQRSSKSKRLSRRSLSYQESLKRLLKYLKLSRLLLKESLKRNQSEKFKSTTAFLMKLRSQSKLKLSRLSILRLKSQSRRLLRKLSQSSKSKPKSQSSKTSSRGLSQSEKTSPRRSSLRKSYQLLLRPKSSLRSRNQSL